MVMGRLPARRTAGPSAGGQCARGKNAAGTLLLTKRSGGTKASSSCPAMTRHPPCRGSGLFLRMHCHVKSVEGRNAPDERVARWQGARVSAWPNARAASPSEPTPAIVSRSPPRLGHGRGATHRSGGAHRHGASSVCPLGPRGRYPDHPHPDRAATAGWPEADRDTGGGGEADAEAATRRWSRRSSVRTAGGGRSRAVRPSQSPISPSTGA
jgi:hypothetical protein